MNSNALLDKSSNWELFEKNIRVLKESQPIAYEKVEAHLGSFRTNPYESAEKIITPVETGVGHKNLLVENKRTGQKYFYHEADPIEETRRTMIEAKLDHPQIVFFLGFGLGYAVQQFHAHRPEKNYVMMVIEPEVEIFLSALLQKDFTEVFAEEDLRILVGMTHEELRGQMYNLLSEKLVVATYLKMLAIPSTIRLHADYFKKFIEMTMKTRDIVTINNGNSIDDTFIGMENMVANGNTYISNIGIKPLLNIAEGKTIISVASGPSTDEHWDQIKAIQGKFPIIVCDSSLKAMLKRGIVPDFVTAIERVSIVTGFFKDVEIPERTALVGPPILLPETLEAYQGEKILYCPASNSAPGLGIDMFGILNSGSSAGNLNISFATYLGFTNIIMVGHNLAYDFETKTSHIKGTFDVRQETPYTEQELKVLSGGFTAPTMDGTGTVYSHTFWDQFRNQMEALIATHHKRNYINVAAKGARIEGTRLMKFADAIELYKDGACDMYELRKSIPTLSAEEVAERRSVFHNKLKAGQERILYWQKAAEKLVTKIERWEKEITEREKAGRKVSLHYLDDALDEILNVKVKAVNEDLDFYHRFVGFISPAHMAFETELNAMPSRYETNYELKRDFVLRHKQYFQIWLKWMPRALKAFESGLS